MRIGLIGPADDQDDLMREAAEFLLGDANVEQAIYLGIDDAVDRLVASWSSEIIGRSGGFLDRAAKLAREGSSAEIEELLAADNMLQRLDDLSTVPRPPARAVEMVDDRIILVVHDKKILDEEDIANSHLIVYGKSGEGLLKKFGPRYFFTPGPLSGKRVGIIDVDADGRVGVALYEPSGVPVWRETLAARSAKLMVSS